MFHEKFKRRAKRHFSYFLLSPLHFPHCCRFSFSNRSPASSILRIPPPPHPHLPEKIINPGMQKFPPPPAPFQ
ncbi:hypothetical protein CEXT_783241 [Caerostris extrusa]|uniref:Uncharacterized protein n=1 Tax=Caerostris extrusa TaxID=172846 RepID=A0AAV4XZE2_CAEEX|nr:hypothetical protein CEXT_783241 [Caerostris extrusa]